MKINNQMDKTAVIHPRRAERVLYLGIIFIDGHLINCWHAGELLMILKDNTEGMRCLLLFFFKREKKCICGAFQLDAVVSEKHLYFFIA